MSDPAEERAAYREALARAEAAALAADSGETPALPEELGPDATPVVASDQIPVAEPVIETATPVAEEVPGETPEQLQARIQQLEDRLAEKDSFIGRQGTEVGELRDALKEFMQREAPAAVPQTPTVLITQDFIDADPARASQLAFEQKDQATLARAFESWKEEDPFGSASWLAEKRIEQANAVQEARYAELEARLAEVAAPVQQDAEQKEWQQAFGLVAKEHPDFVPDAARIIEEVAPLYPHLVETLATGKAPAKAEILKALYVLDRAQNPDAVKAQLEDAVAAAASEEAATRTAAGVVAGQPTAGRSAEEQSYEEQEQSRYKERIGGGVSLATGWTGRKTS